MADRTFLTSNFSRETTLNLMLIVTAFIILLIIGDNVKTSLQGSAFDAQNYEKRKKYFEEVILPAKLDLHPAKYYIVIDK